MVISTSCNQLLSNAIYAITMKPKSISFIRQYHGYTGGHQKVRDYISHFLSFGWSPSLFLNKTAVTNKDLFDNIPHVYYQERYMPEDSDIVFLAGMDWERYLQQESTNRKIINLIQHVRHADPNQALFKYLKEPAIRLCVSEAVRDAILPHANGPCYVIKMGHILEPMQYKKDWDIYILANKQAELGSELTNWFRTLGYRVLVHTSTQEHRQVIEAMASSRLTVALPHETEGFYLPGIEAMYYSNMAVVPYCVANKEYFSRYSNLMMPNYSFDNIRLAALSALKKSRQNNIFRRYIGRRIAVSYSLENERKQLANILKKHFN